jgi:magnesium-transporting ATPase (P-type)
VGISGVEGLQAARSSDYSIAQFRFLQRLLLVHGRWSYRRNSKLILYSFYKNTTMFLCQLWFVFYNGYSGQTLFESWTMAMYNLIFTAFPVLALAVFERDVSARAALMFPKLYSQGRQNKLFSAVIFWTGILNAIFHSALCFFIPHLVTKNDVLFSSGRTISLFPMGLMVYGCVMVTVTCKLALETAAWTVWNAVATIGSMVLWFLFLIVYNSLYAQLPKFGFLADPYYYFYMAASSAQFWLLIMIVPVVALSRDFIFKFYKRHYYHSGTRKWLYMIQYLDSQGVYEQDAAAYLADEADRPAPATGLTRFHVESSPHKSAVRRRK